MPPSYTFEQARRSLSWYLTWAWLFLKYLLWQLLTKLVLGVVYFVLIAEGMRQVLPMLGTRLAKFPGLSFLNDFEGLHKLDLAHVMSILVLIFVWMQWRELLLAWLSPDDQENSLGWRPRRHREISVGLGVVVLTVDAALFYYAMADLSWDGSWFSLTALLATAAYVAILIFVTLISINLHRAFKNHTQRDW